MVAPLQDTDKKQIRLLEDIVPTWRQAITVCGDANQAIYGIFALVKTRRAIFLLKLNEASKAFEGR